MIRKTYGSNNIHYKISNANAVKLIKNLSINKDKTKLSKIERIDIIKNAFKIYEQIGETKGYFVTSELFKLCLDFQYPHKIFSIWNDILKNRNISFVLLLKCCIQSGDINKSIQVLQWIKNDGFNQYQYKSVSINVTKLISLCNNDIEIIHQIHQLIDTFESLKSDLFIKTALINAYGNHSDLQNATKIFDSIGSHQMDNILVSNMMKVFIQNDSAKQALSVYDEYINSNKSNYNDINVLLAIKACINANCFDRGIDLIAKHIDLRNASINMKNTLINFYQHFGDFTTAINTFDSIKLCERSSATIGCVMNAFAKNGMNDKVISLYNEHPHLIDVGLHRSVIAAYSNIHDIKSIVDLFESVAQNHKYGIIGCVMKALIENNCDEMALSIYNDYNNDNMCADNAVSHIMALRACMNLNDCNSGKQIITDVSGRNMSIELQTMVIDFYQHFGDINNAQIMFNSLIDKNYETVVSVCTMIKGLVNNEYYEQALSLYDTYICLCNDTMHLLALKACRKSNNFEKGKQIHSNIDNEMEINLANTLVDFYGDFADIINAQNIFNAIVDNDKMNVVISSIGAMMNAYYQNKMYYECIQLFKNINRRWKHLNPDIICYTIVLNACAQSTSYHFGDGIYKNLTANIDGNEWMLSDSNMQCALIDFYAKSGDMNMCRQIFNDIENKSNNIYVWNSMLNAYAKNFDFKNAKQIFDITPKRNKETLIAFINCCGHCGEIQNAFNVWQCEILKYDSYIMSSLIDCYSRNGLIKEAFDLLMQYETHKVKESENDKVMWIAILNGCNIYKNDKIGKIIYDEMKARFNSDAKIHGHT